jgi:hypothetical protein
MADNLKINEFQNLEGADFTGPNDCSGDACNSITLRAKFHPGTTMVKSITVQNSSAKTVDVEITWGGVFTPCSATSFDSIFPNNKVEMYTPNEYISGYCKITANNQ